MSSMQKWLVRLSFGLFIGWIMSFPYEGPLLYALADYLHFDGVFFNSISVGIVAAGILSSALFVKRWQTGKQLMLGSVIVSLIGVAIIQFLPNILILPVLLVLAYLSGLFISAWGVFFYHNTPANERGKAVADVLIIGNVVLTISAVMATWFEPWIGMLFCLMVLLATLITCQKMVVSDGLPTVQDMQRSLNREHSFTKPLAVFLGFIFLISLSAGIMFQVVYPHFGDFEVLASIYTNLPYILALYILRSMPMSMNKNFTLNLGISILGVSYALFAFMGEGMLKFFFVMTPMLIAYGIFDYFWWRIMGDLCPYGYTPALIVGLSLSVNVFGVFFGGLMSLQVMSWFSLSSTNMAFFALSVIFIIISILPILNAQMGRLLTDHIFFVQYASKPAVEQEVIIEKLPHSEVLTERELEIVNQVLSGLTYSAIAKNLFLSDNTVKTHTKNIYRKLNVNSKYELVRHFQILNKGDAI